MKRYGITGIAAVAAIVALSACAPRPEIRRTHSHDGSRAM